MMEILIIIIMTKAHSCEEKPFTLILKLSASSRIQRQVTCNINIKQLKLIVLHEFNLVLDKIKFIYKGRIVSDDLTLKEVGICNKALINVVINKFVKRKKHSMISPTIPTKLQSGLGLYNPVGYDNLNLINHPQYLSSISQAIIGKSIETESQAQLNLLMEELMKQPQTLMKLINQNPITKRIVNSTPMMKTMMKDPQLFQKVINPETFKFVNQLQIKNQFDLAADELDLVQIKNGLPVIRKLRYVYEQSEQYIYKEHIQKMKSVGLTDLELNLQALKKNNGDVQQAIRELLG